MDTNEYRDLLAAAIQRRAGMGQEPAPARPRPAGGRVARIAALLRITTRHA